MYKNVSGANENSRKRTEKCNGVGDFDRFVVRLTANGGAIFAVIPP